MRDMTKHDRMRLKAHRGVNKLFRKVVNHVPILTVCDLTATEYKNLRTLLELGYVAVEEGAIVIQFTVSSVSELEYIE